MIKKRINIDVDGVLYPMQKLEDYHKIGVYTKDFAINGAYAFVQALRATGAEIKFLTKTFSDAPHLHEIHASEKELWLMKHMKAKEEEIIVLPATENKEDSSYGILIDDYGYNCEQWETEAGNISIQIFEDRVKNWLTTSSYDDCLRIVENIINRLEASSQLEK